MTRAVVVLVAAASLVVPAGGAAQDRPHEVRALFADFAPSPLDVLPGETVEWNNVSERRHTVTAEDGSFDSGEIEGGERFAHRFDAPGAFDYHCTIHAGMDGHVDVRHVILGPLAAAAVPVGDEVEFSGRTSDSSRLVTIERYDGKGFRAVAEAAPAADGSWSTVLRAQSTGDYRATAAGHASQTRRLLVSDRRLVVRATRRGIAVRVTPPAPYGRVQLHAFRRERFGWWPDATRRLDYLSETVFPTKPRRRVRVVLVDRDGWTALATSRVLKLGGGGRTRSPRTPPAHHH